MTSTPTLAAAQAAIEAGLAKIPEGYDAATIDANIAVGYAVTYIFGLIGLILFLQFVPKILGFNLKKEVSHMRKI